MLHKASAFGVKILLLIGLGTTDSVTAKGCEIETTAFSGMARIHSQMAVEWSRAGRGLSSGNCVEQKFAAKDQQRQEANDKCESPEYLPAIRSALLSGECKVRPKP